MIIASTSRGIICFSDDGEVLSRALRGRDIGHIAFTSNGRLMAVADENTILLGPHPDQAWADEMWQRLGTLQHRANCLCQHRDRIFAGAADARMYVVQSSETTAARKLESFDRAPTRQEWDTPWGGPPDVRSLAAIEDSDTPALYADIHVGGIMRSFDAGQSWSAATGTLHRDVHRVETHPDLPDTVFAATQQGFFRSDDRGDTWKGVLAPFLPRNYQRAVVIDCDDPDLLLVTASLGPHPDGETGCEGQIFRSVDGGSSFSTAHGGLPEHFYHNLDTHLIAASRTVSGLFAFHDDERTLFVTSNGARRWDPIATVEDVTTVLVV
ncbi:MAG: hypothetical protein R6V19_17985 [Armatimonadota bacterium]